MKRPQHKESAARRMLRGARKREKWVRCLASEGSAAWTCSAEGETPSASPAAFFLPFLQRRATWPLHNHSRRPALKWKGLEAEAESGRQYGRLHNAPFLLFLLLVIVYNLNGEKKKEGMRLLEELVSALGQCYTAAVAIHLPGRDAVPFLCCLSSQVSCHRGIYYLHCVTRCEYIYVYVFSILPLWLCLQYTWANAEEFRRDCFRLISTNGH